MPPNGSPPARKRPPSSADAPAAKAGPPARRSSSGVASRAAAAPESSADAAKLVCTAGPSAGTEFPLTVAEVVIGRAAENAVSIPDTSVSRRHAQMRKVGLGWVASDLGSGNGTLVNGEPLTEETPLRNGDVLTCGDTELSFMDGNNSTDRRPVPTRRTASSGANLPVRQSGSGSPARPRVMSARARAAADTEAPKRKKRLTIYAGVFLILCSATFVAVKYQQKIRAKKDAVSAAVDAQRRAEIADIFQNGKNLVRSGKWAEARAQFEKIQQLDPSNPLVADYLRAADKEMPNQANLAAAEAALSENKVGAAFDALQKVTTDTQQFERLRALRTLLDEKIISRIAEAKAASDIAPKVSSATDTSKWNEVVTITADVLTANPDNRDAKVLNELAKEQIAILTRPKAVAPPPPQQPWVGAINLFVDGDITGAFSVANACAGKFARCKTLLGQMQDFQGLYKKMEDLDARGLSQLLTIDAKITESKGPSKMARNAGTRAATIYYKSASAAKVSGQWAKALEYALKTLKADAGHSGAQQLVGEMRAKAKELYLSAYAMKDSSPEEATTKFREVMAMTPNEDETHQKAQHWIQELSR